MDTFKIGKDFLLNNKPIKIISGAIHYFRLSPEQWPLSLQSLHALGANTVETYLPWNLHEPKEGMFDFDGMKNVFHFIELAQKEGLYVILRPSPYICAEWEFGGLPAWLLKEKQIRLRTDDPIFLEKIDHYYAHLIPKLLPYQITEGGPVLMMQVENEYGSYGMDKTYLKKVRDLMLKYGVTVPLFTSDGAWEEVLDAGSLPEEDILVTGNFGGHSEENIATMKKWMAEHQKEWPIMCMECWDGWFNRWGENIIKRGAEDFAQTARNILEVGSINLYMFHGGTSFGFYSGTSVREYKALPQITSYDYDALLTEAGEPTEKYYAVQRVIKDLFPDVWQAEPVKKTQTELGTFPVKESVSLFNTKDSLFCKKTDYPLTMEELDSNYGYVLYSLNVKNYHKENKLRIVEANDRVQIFMNESLLETQYQESLGSPLSLPETQGDTLAFDILVENIGRTNYGYTLNSPTQSKGIRGGVVYDLHFHKGYSQYPLSLIPEELEKIDFSQDANPETPSFYRFDVDLEDVQDTYVDCSYYGKGSVIVNGHHLGRYWSIGPVLSLYCPKGFLREGKNEVIIFETEGVEITELSFVDHPIKIVIEESN